MKQSRPKLGEAAIVTWKKQDESAYGGTEGVVLGIAGDKVSGQYLIIDRSTYQDSFKSALSLLGIFDFRVIPIESIASVTKTNLRKRPPGVSEKLKMRIEVNYESNIDFEETTRKLRRRSDCNVTPMRNDRSEAEYGRSIKRIKAIEGASINIMATGALQIFCFSSGLDDCISWLQGAVELLQDHKRLVLIPTKIMYAIHDSYKEKQRPTEEVIKRIANAQEGQPVVFPIGWAHRLFVELDANPLQALFPTDQNLDDCVFESEKRENIPAAPSSEPGEGEPKHNVDLRFPWSNMKATKYLGADVPTMQITGLIKKPEDENGLMQMWLGSRSDSWQWFESENIQGKMIIRDVTIDKKAGVYTCDLQRYSGNEF